MSNPYSKEILGAISTRIDPERLHTAHIWVRHRLQAFGPSALMAEAGDLIAWSEDNYTFGEHSTLQEGIARLQGESFKASRLLRQPALWLLSALAWMLTEDMGGDEPDEKALDLHDIVGRMFVEGSRSHAILSEHLGAGEDDQISLLGGAMWSLSHLTTLTAILIRAQGDMAAVDIASWPTQITIGLLGDLNTEILSDSRLDQFRTIARRRRERAVQGDEEAVGEDGEGIPDIDLGAAVREVVQRAERRGEGNDNGKDGEM